METMLSRKIDATIYSVTGIYFSPESSRRGFCEDYNTRVAPEDRIPLFGFGKDELARDIIPTFNKFLLIAPPEIILTDLSFEASYVQGDRSYAQRYEQEGRELTRLYRELASRRGILFADASSWDLDFAFDAVHLSEKGHTVFGREMIRVMQEVQNGN